ICKTSRQKSRMVETSSSGSGEGLVGNGRATRHCSGDLERRSGGASGTSPRPPRGDSPSALGASGAHGKLCTLSDGKTCSAQQKSAAERRTPGSLHHGFLVHEVIRRVTAVWANARRHVTPSEQLVDSHPSKRATRIAMLAFTTRDP